MNRENESEEGLIRLMDLSPVLLTAGVLGVTHGIEPDHTAGILSLVSESGNAKLAAAVGACFAAGHVALVLLWIAVARFLLEITSFPGILERFGTVVLGLVLVLLSAAVGLAGARQLVHEHEHSHPEIEGAHRHPHLHLPIGGADHRTLGAPTHPHDHTAGEYLKIGVVGALFTLSPPLSMIAFITVTMGETGGGEVAVAVLVYAVAIGLTMAVIGGGVGKGFGAIRSHGRRAYAMAQIVSAALVFSYGCYFLWRAVPSLIGSP